MPSKEERACDQRAIRRPAHRAPRVLSARRADRDVRRPDARRSRAGARPGRDAVAAGRWVAGWVGYEAAPAFDDAFVVRPTDDTPFADLPLVWFAVFTHRLPVDEPEGQQAGETAGQPVSRPADGPSGEPVGESLVGWTPTIDAPRYRADIAAVHARIRAGDTYQVNHTFRLSAPFDGDAERLYGRLVRAQRAGYGACLAAGRWTVASASPRCSSNGPATRSAAAR